jgi:hypothetical protein
MSLSSSPFRVSAADVEEGMLRDHEARRRRYLMRYVLAAVILAGGICLAAGVRVAVNRADRSDNPSGAPPLSYKAAATTSLAPADPTIDAIAAPPAAVPTETTAPVAAMGTTASPSPLAAAMPSIAPVAPPVPEALIHAKASSVTVRTAKPPAAAVPASHRKAQSTPGIVQDSPF